MLPQEQLFTQEGSPAIPLITLSNQQFQLTQPGLSLLNSLSNQTLHIATICGPQRSGKSYLANQLFSPSQSFPLGHTTQPCTQGLWVSHKQIGPNESVLLIDVEGINSTKRDKQLDGMLFALSVLLSTLVVYNQMGHIDDAQIDSLGIMMKISELFQSQKIRENLGLIWVCRDFSLQLRGTEQEYLEDCLERKNTPQDGIRTAVKSLFRQRECVCLVRPMFEENSLQNMSGIRQEFAMGVGRVKSHFARLLGPKVVQGVRLNGDMFVNLLQSYLNAFNQNKMPQIQSSLENIKQSQARKIREVLQQDFEQKLAKVASIDKLPFDSEELLMAYQQVEQKVLTNLEMQAKSLVDPGTLNKLKHELQEAFDQKLSYLFNLNKEKSQAVCGQLAFQHINSSKLDPVLTYEQLSNNNLQNFQQSFTQFFQHYNQNAKGPGKVGVIQNQLFPYLFQQFSLYDQSVQKVMNEEIQSQKITQDLFSRKEERLNSQIQGQNDLILDLEKANDMKDIQLNEARKEKENMQSICQIIKEDYESLKTKYDQSREKHQEKTQKQRSEIEQLEKENKKLQSEVQKGQMQQNQFKSQLDIYSHSNRFDSEMDTGSDLSNVLQDLRYQVNIMDDVQNRIQNYEQHSYLDKMKSIYDEKNQEIQAMNENFRAQLARIKKDNEDNLKRILVQNESISKNNESIKSQLIEMQRKQNPAKIQEKVNQMEKMNRDLKEELQIKGESLRIHSEVTEEQKRQIEKITLKFNQEQMKLGQAITEKNLLKSYQDQIPLIIQEFLKYQNKDPKNKFLSTLNFLQGKEKQILENCFIENGIKLN